ncbi:MAG: DUF2341 domain-containing protein, partial [Pirellulaceae bacterium]|nr:DUF2341 domain-containing protein [Pirellulaceae bacterium]
MQDDVQSRGGPRLAGRVVVALLALANCSRAVAAPSEPLAGWKHAGTLTVLTTPDGANLPAEAAVEQFPLLVRLDRDWFDFSEARPDGEDVRFTTAEGQLLPHQIDEWNGAAGTASLWVRVPRIRGNAVLPLRMHWGKADAPSTSDGKGVFDAANGYLGVWHLADPVSDATGTLPAQDSGTKATTGIIGSARHFPGEAGIFCGDKISGYPTGNQPHTMQLWFSAERSNVSLLGFGTQTRQGKAVMQLRGPPHIDMDCWFSDGNVKSAGRLALGEWHHAVFAYESGQARVYLNGVLAGRGGRGTPLNLGSPAGLWIGGWFRDFSFVGDLDEVRVSSVTRSADWVRLEYENQKPLQMLVGPLMRADINSPPSAGSDLVVMPDKAIVKEGGRARITAQAAGALKLTWSLVCEGQEKVLAVDRFAFDYVPGRVTGDRSAMLRLTAVFADGAKSVVIPVAIQEAIPDPDFTLTAPEKWDGRSPIELVPSVTNLAAMSEAGAKELQLAWSAGPAAVVKETVRGKLRLLAAQKSGPLTITATLSSGGDQVARSATIQVVEPADEPWVERPPAADEKPEEGQFFARDDRNEANLHYRGTLRERADEVFLRVFADDRPFATQSARPDADLSYALAVKLHGGLVKYRVEFGSRTGGVETIHDRVGDLVCGDAFLIEGQSNAQAIADLPDALPRETSEWIRTFAGPTGYGDATTWVRDHQKPRPAGERQPSLWRRAVWRNKAPEHDTSVGWWGQELAKRLVASQKVPIFVLNGAVGGTRIDQHQRNPENPADLATIYGRWLWRLRQARLTHGIRGVIWHQGENDQPADTPSGDFGWVNYQSYFGEMAAGWRRDLPNARHYYLFQIWPSSCGMGKEGSGDRLREAQRTLPERFSNLGILPTLDIRPPGGCHYPQ